MTISNMMPIKPSNLRTKTSGFGAAWLLMMRISTSWSTLTWTVFWRAPLVLPPPHTVVLRLLVISLIVA